MLQNYFIYKHSTEKTKYVPRKPLDCDIQAFPYYLGWIQED